jgi:hypothetical protein
MTLKTNFIDWTIDRDGTEIDLSVAYRIIPFMPAKTDGPPEDCYPAEPAVISDVHATADGVTVELTNDELEQFWWHLTEYDGAMHRDDEDRP